MYSQSKGRNTDKKVLDSFIFSAHRIAKSQALGLGWINHTRGYYRRALLHNIYPARALFTFADDKLNVARLNLLEGAILRVLAGYDQEKLKKAINLIEDSMSEFEGHQRYSAKATYELVLGHLYMENLTEARKALIELTKLAKSIEDKRWLFYSSILGSRIDLRMGTPASIARAKDQAELAIGFGTKARPIVL